MTQRPTLRLAVVLPAFNEARSIGTVLASLREAQPQATAIVVNDHSSDDTAAIARAAGATVLNMPFQFGAWTAAQTGMRYAFRHDFDVVVTMDADGQHDAGHIGALLDAMQRHGADLVVGACVDRASRLRRVAWRWLRAISNLQVADLTSGFRAYSRRAIAVAASWAATNFDYQDIGLLLLLQRRGLAIVEQNVPMAPRRDGKSRVFSSWMAVAHYMAQSSILAGSKRSRRPPPTGARRTAT